MKPIIASATSSSSASNTGNNSPRATASSNANGVNIPMSHEYSNNTPQQPYYYNADGNNGMYGSPRQQQQPQQPIYNQSLPQQPTNQPHFQQGFGFDPDMDMDMDIDMFPRSRIGRHDPFAGFGGSNFDFPQFGSMGRRRTGGDHMGEDRDFFNRLPNEFRQYIPDSFRHRRAGSGAAPSHQVPTQQPCHQNYAPAGASGPTCCTPQPYGGATAPAYCCGVSASPSKTLCDAAIQTDDPRERCEVDSTNNIMQTDHLNQHGLRNTMDMGVGSAAENENHIARAHSAPPPEQQQQHQQHQQQPTHQQPTASVGAQQMPTAQPTQTRRPNFGTQTSHSASTAGQQVPIQRTYYPPQQQAYAPQMQSTAPQTPGGTYVRTIPIFVEGRSEPVINSHKEIPNQYAGNVSASASARAGTPQQQYPYQQQQPHYSQQHNMPPTAQQPYQQHNQATSPPQPQQFHQQRPTPLNTQQQAQHEQQPGEEASGAGLPPQTPHTLDSISKIQDIQRDVLDLMAKVENFTGLRQDKEYVYLDEMLTRNLLKLDTIDTNGKESIRLARKEAIKCIQASINVLEAKAEGNAKRLEGGERALVKSSSSREACALVATNEQTNAAEHAVEPVDATKLQEAIPLPPPEGMKTNDEQLQQQQEGNVSNAADNSNSNDDIQQQKEGSPANGGISKTSSK